MSLYSKRPRLQFGNFATDDFFCSADTNDWKSFGGRGMDRIRCKRPPARGRGRAGHCHERYRTRSVSISGLAPKEPYRLKRRRLSVAPGSGKGRTDRYGGGQGERARRYSMGSVAWSRPQVLSRVPGGSISDPLNLQAIGRGEELPDPPALPEPDPKRFDKPVNNFIPTNHEDPLGLTQREDDQTPVCLPYNPNKRKRVRARKKDPAVTAGAEVPTSQSGSSTADSSSIPPHAPATSSLSKTSDGAIDHISSQSSASVLSSSEAPEKHKPVAVTVELAAEVCSSKDAVKVDSASHKTEPSITDTVKVEPNSSGVPSDADGEPSSSHSVSESYKSDLAKSRTSSVGQCVPQSKINSDGQGIIDMEMDVLNKETSEKTVDKASKKQKTASRSTCPPPSQSQSGNKRTHQKHLMGHFRMGQSEQYNNRLEYERVMKQEQQRSRMYPILQSPIDEEERQEVPRDRKSLRKALRIEPFGKEERERVIKEQEKKERDFKRLWRYPNLKSPAEEEHSSKDKQSSMEVLKIDTNLSANISPDKSRGRSILRGPPSRTVDSIVSPVLRPDPAQIRKRRRTVSECSREAAASATKALHFRRSSSPDVSMTSTPRKMRRLSFGSGGSKVKKQEEETKTPTPMKFAKNPVFKHGNYSRYYGYRTPEMEPDLRLQYFRLEWFEGKDVLDIGCNAGHVTLAVAKLFHPQKIVGMDIDPNLIRAARQNIKRFQNLANKDEMKKYPVSMTEYGPIEPLPALTNPSNFFPKNIMFMQGNYVLERDEQLSYVKEEYDTILALSITKWIHLNWGDDGLKRVFARMYQQLRPGGKLILEPQAWASYRRRKKLTEAIYKNYTSIKLKPERFSEYLLNTVGFCKREVIGLPFNPSKGFRRPLLLFTKFSDQSGNSPLDSSSANPSSLPPISIAERMASLAGYSSTPGVDTPGLDTPGLDTPGLGMPGPDTPGLGTPGQGQGTPGVQPPSVGLAENSSFCSSGSSSSSLCSTCMSNTASSSSSTGSNNCKYTPSQGYPGSVNESFDFEVSPPESNTLEENAREQETMGGPEEQAEEGAPFEEPMVVEGELPQPVYSDELEPNYPPFYVSGDEEELLQNGIAQDGESSEWIPLAVENICPDPEQAGIENQDSPLGIDQPLQDVEFHPLPNGSDSQFDQDDSLDQPDLNYSPGQLVQENSPELVQDSTPEQLVQDSYTEQFVEDSYPEQSVQENSPELVQDSTPEQLVQDSYTEQFVEDSYPEQSVQENSPEELVQDSTPEQLVQDSYTEQFVEDSYPEQSVQENSPELVQDSTPEQLVQDSYTEQFVEDSYPEQSVQENSPEELVQDSTPEQLVQDSYTEQFAHDSNPEQSVQGKSPEELVQDCYPEQLGVDNSAGQLVQDSSPEQSARNSSPKQSVQDS